MKSNKNSQKKFTKKIHKKNSQKNSQKNIIKKSHKKKLKFNKMKGGFQKIFINNVVIHIREIKWSYDNKTIAFYDILGNIKLWNVKQDNEEISEEDISILKLGQTGRYVSVIDWSRDNTKIICGVENNIIEIWDVDSKKCINRLRNHTESITSVSCGINNLLVSCSVDQTVLVWNIDTGACLNVLRDHTDIVNCVSFSPNGSMFASCSNDSTIRIYTLGENINNNVQYNIHSSSLNGHTNNVNLISWCSDNVRLLSVSSDNTLRIWNTTKLKEIFNFQFQQRIDSVSWSPDKSKIVFANNNDVIFLDGTTYRELSRSTVKNPIFSLAWGRNLLKPPILAISNFKGEILLNDEDDLDIRPVLTSQLANQPARPGEGFVYPGNNSNFSIRAPLLSANQPALPQKGFVPVINLSSYNLKS